jgi:hypothetical protein
MHSKKNASEDVNILEAVLEAELQAGNCPIFFPFLTYKLVIGHKGCCIKSLFFLGKKVESFWCLGAFMGSFCPS